jgi:VWFA-related protein
MIRLDVVVTDQSGNPVTGLRQQDFTLRDNGEPAKIVSFQAFDGVTAKPDPPVVVILVIDELDLPTGPLADAKHEAESFLRQNGGQLSQPVSIYRISSEGLSGSAEPSWDGNALADEIAQGREPHVIWKPSMVFDDLAGIAVKSKPHHALLALGSIAIEQRRRPGRKLMFWLGRGWQFKTATESAAFDFVTEFSTRLREARIDLWSATEWPFYDQYGRPLLVTHFIYKDYLEDLTPKTVTFSYLALHIVATQTGGGVLETSNDLGGKIGKRVGEASTFYSLTFDPPRTDEVDEYHTLKVEVGKPDLTAHTSTGYFDEPVFYDQSPAGIERVTVEQLEHALSTIEGRSDAEVARQLSCMELSERLSTAKLATLEARLKGKKARQALVALADESVFLAPPAGEIPSTAPPDAATQRLMISRTVNYVDKALPKLPNFFANRTMVQYHELPPKPGQTWRTAAGDESLYLDETFKATMLFRDGKEVVKEETTKGNPLKPGERTLSTVGTFGPLLATVLVGATSAHSDLTWSRWEQGANGPQAVFRYRVPQETPLFFVGFGYLANDDRMVPFQKKAAFHGEFAVDPASGAILRLTVQADLEARLPLERSDVMVEYSPVVIGGSTYFCPARSVSIVRQRTAMNIHEWGENFKVYAPFETILSDMAYEKYHVFHPTARMLPGFTPEREDK